MRRARVHAESSMQFFDNAPELAPYHAEPPQMPAAAPGKNGFLRLGFEQRNGCSELSELAHRWDLPLDDDGLRELLRVAHDPDDGCVADAPEILTFARLALAANEAVRCDCPLWLVGQ